MSVLHFPDLHLQNIALQHIHFIKLNILSLFSKNCKRYFELNTNILCLYHLVQEILSKEDDDLVDEAYNEATKILFLGK